MSACSCPTLRDPVDCSPPGSSVYGIFQGRILEWAAISLSRDLPDPGIEPVSPALAGRFFTTEPPGKPLKERCCAVLSCSVLSDSLPMNTGVGSLSLLQGIFPTQKSNRGFLHCRQICQQLSYQGSLKERQLSAKVAGATRWECGQPLEAGKGEKKKKDYILGLPEKTC